MIVYFILRSEHGRVIMVTSGGMLLEKLDHDDPQLFKQKAFDGVKTYAQNKRQMVKRNCHKSSSLYFDFCSDTCNVSVSGGYG